jgi:hypothetical protein
MDCLKCFEQKVQTHDYYFVREQKYQKKGQSEKINFGARLF